MKNITEYRSQSSATSLNELELTQTDLEAHFEEIYSKLLLIYEKIKESKDYQDNKDAIDSHLEKLTESNSVNLAEIKSYSFAEDTKTLILELSLLLTSYRKIRDRLSFINKEVVKKQNEILTQKSINLLARIDFENMAHNFQKAGKDINSDEIDFFINFLSSVGELEKIFDEIMNKDDSNIFFKDNFVQHLKTLENFLQTYANSDYISNDNEQKIDKYEDFIQPDAPSKTFLLEEMEEKLEKMDGFIELYSIYNFGYVPNEIYSYRSYLSNTKNLLKNSIFPILHKKFEFIEEIYRYLYSSYSKKGYSQDTPHQEVEKFQRQEEVDYEALLNRIIFEGIDNNATNEVMILEKLKQLLLDFIPPCLVKKIEKITFVPEFKLKNSLKNKYKSNKFESDVKFDLSFVDELIPEFLFTGYVSRTENEIMLKDTTPDLLITNPARISLKRDNLTQFVIGYQIFIFIDHKIHSKTTEFEKSYKKKDLIESVFHEIGHIAHQDMTCAEMIEWSTAVATDIVDVTWYVSHSKTKNEETGKKEDFAESFFMFLRKPLELKDKSPNRFTFFLNYFTRRVQERQRKAISAYIQNKVNDMNSFLRTLQSALEES